MRKIIKTAAFLMIYAVVLSVPVCAAEETETMTHGKIEGELKDGIYTIRIQATDHDDPELYWTSWEGDKGDASYVELLTQTDREDGLVYAGSFRAVPGAGDGEDFIRLVHTNGKYTAEYLDWNVSVKDNEIVEITGGSQAFPTTGNDLAPVLEGTWEEENGNLYMEISPEEDGSLAFLISDGGGRDGLTEYYTMHAYYDAVKEALVYWDGEAVTAEITVGGEEALTDTEKVLSVDSEEAAGADEGMGTGVFALEMTDADRYAILWRDDTFGNTDTGSFVRKIGA